jgi:hypothetical protein
MPNFEWILLKEKPPTSEAAEKALLGSLIMDSSRLSDAIRALSPTDFYVDKNRNVFEGLIEMDLKSKKIDLITLTDYLHGKISAAYLSALTDGVVKTSSPAFDEYLKNIKETSWLRKMITEGAKLVALAYHGDIEETRSSLQDFAAKFTQPELTLTEKVKKWVALSDGDFSLSDIKNSLENLSKRDLNNIYQILHSLKKEGIIEKIGHRQGVYRKPAKDIEVLDWKNADDMEYPIELPLELSKLTCIYPKSIIVIAGLFNVGKTAFCLDTIRLNQEKTKIHYFTSEMGANKLRQRLKKFENVDFPGGWNFNAVYRAAEWADCIKNSPDDINIIDYLQIGENFWAVSEYIDKIFNSLKNGIAIICLQKSFGKILGRGGDFSAERASLYLSIDPGILKIVKAKEWRGTENPNGKFKRFKLIGGWKFLPDPEWMTEDMEQAIKNMPKEKKGIWIK